MRTHIEGKELRALMLLHALLVFFSFSGVFSKLASRETFLSLRFCLFYAGLILILGVYAIFWQQIIKRLPISIAYANKAVSVIWSMIWGAILFGESISLKKIIGGVIVITGIILFSSGESHEQD
ncbi:MAG: EamA family transporter [Saccharofermentans sp.]|nr:EamA family transporter [Saccharofermentans sp.]